MPREPVEKKDKNRWRGGGSVIEIEFEDRVDELIRLYLHTAGKVLLLRVIGPGWVQPNGPKCHFKVGWLGGGNGPPCVFEPKRGQDKPDKSPPQKKSWWATTWGGESVIKRSPILVEAFGAPKKQRKRGDQNNRATDGWLWRPSEIGKEAMEFGRPAEWSRITTRDQRYGEIR